MKYLALGDSYTIGALVNPEDNFPNQLVRLLKDWRDIDPPKIIAQTGWTSEELYRQVKTEVRELTNDYDFVTLLIGANDQYRDMNLAVYEQYFLKLLLQAILLARGQSRRVYVLSVPDWGITPFAQKEGKDKEKVAEKLHSFNSRSKILSMAYRCHYLDITPLSRHQGEDKQYLAEDGLHYSAKAYSEWATRLAKLIQETLPRE